MAEKKFPLGCQCSFDVFSTLYILLTTIYHTNIPCGRDGREGGGGREERGEGKEMGDEEKEKETRKRGGKMREGR